MDEKFSRQYRLVSKQDFRAAFIKPHKIARKNLIVLYKSNQKSLARLGIVISKKYARRAVDRNLLRRVIRESFRQQKEALKGLDLIVLLRTECTPLDKKALRDDIGSLWQTLQAKLVLPGS
jgi:ribonuclease P protein component